jgi:parallel beta-helix repeat protein
MIRYLVAVFVFSVVASAQVTLHPGDNVPKIVNSKPAGTTFIFTAGTYRLSESIHPKNNDKFVGETQCAPPASACPAIISGATVIGPLAKFDGTNYAVTNQKQRNPYRETRDNCDPGWLGCLLAEDLYFDDVPYKHIYSDSMPTIGPQEWWFDYPNHTIYFHDDPSGHNVETSVVPNAFGGPGNNVTIQYLTIEKFASMMPVGAIGETQGAKAQTQETNWTIENCEVRLNHAFGIRVNYRMHILNNYAHDNGQNGISGGLGMPAAPVLESMNSGIVIQGNTVNHNDYAHFNPQFGAGGIKIGATSGVIVKDNIIENNEGAGMHFDDDSGNELVDGNIISGNTDGDALAIEIGYGVSIFRNNQVLRNGFHINTPNFSHQIYVRASGGAEVYCNVMEIPNARGIAGWGIGASNRGNSHYPPFEYRTSAGNYFHHNTVIWDPGAHGEVGYRQADTENQPEFFTKNKAPDYNQYHLSNGSDAVFVYDGNNSGANKLKNFRGYQESGADVHSTVDTKDTSGWPKVKITSPEDQSTVSSPVTVTAEASDKSGIKKVEFYVDWDLQKTVTSPPYDFDWSNGSSGSHVVAAMAYSNAGIRNCNAVTLNQP